jgi:hypothetical protein
MREGDERRNRREMRDEERGDDWVVRVLVEMTRRKGEMF